MLGECSKDEVDTARNARGDIRNERKIFVEKCEGHSDQLENTDISADGRKVFKRILGNRAWTAFFWLEMNLVVNGRIETTNLLCVQFMLQTRVSFDTRESLVFNWSSAE